MFEKRTMQPREKIIIDNNMRAIKRITKEKLIEVNMNVRVENNAILRQISIKC